MEIQALDDLLIAAGEAPPETRILLRDQVAAYGTFAIARLMGDAWIGDLKYAGFAIQAIKKAGELGARDEAIDALRRAGAVVSNDGHKTDIAAALVVLGARHPSSGARFPRPSKDHHVAVISPEDLVVGNCYRRADLHDAGLGGNRQKGISYPVGGTHCLLFSDPSKASEYGYRDAPVGDEGYRYFGEWSGSGDMTMTGGNQVILDRSPELYLFTSEPCGRVFRGRFECLGRETETTTRDDHELIAIVFRLERITA